MFGYQIYVLIPKLQVYPRFFILRHLINGDFVYSISTNHNKCISKNGRYVFLGVCVYFQKKLFSVCRKNLIDFSLASEHFAYEYMRIFYATAQQAQKVNTPRCRYCGGGTGSTV